MFDPVPIGARPRTSGSIVNYLTTFYFDDQEAFVGVTNYEISFAVNFPTIMSQPDPRP
jgi:hypothetical protein